MACIRKDVIQRGYEIKLIELVEPQHPCTSSNFEAKCAGGCDQGVKATENCPPSDLGQKEEMKKKARNNRMK